MTVLRLCLALLLLAALPAHAQNVSEKSATVNGVRINYKIAGTGPAVVLLHGYTQTSHMWLPLIPRLSPSYTVIAPDLRGIGGSERTAGGYDKKTMAKDIRELVHHLGHKQVMVVGHDIGLMVACLRRAYPDEVSKVILMDAFLPGWANGPRCGCCATCGTSTSTARPRSRSSRGASASTSSISGTTSPPIARSRSRSATETLRRGLCARRRHARRLRGVQELRAGREGLCRLRKPQAGNAVPRADRRKGLGTFLIEQTKLVAVNVTGVVVKGSGHWLMEEAPGQVIPAIVDFLRK